METSYPFNALSPAEAERLALLMEEMGEAVQVIGKILRHGYGSRHPEGDYTNRELLEKEMGHVQHALNRMITVQDLRMSSIVKWEIDKQKTVRRYLHHQGDQA